MNHVQKTLLVSVYMALAACSSQDPSSEKVTTSEIVEDTLKQQTEISQTSSSFLLKNGKRMGQTKMEHIYESVSLDSLDFPIIDSRFHEALQAQYKLLKNRKRMGNQMIGSLQVTKQQLKETIKILEQYQQTKPLELSNELHAHQLWGKDQRGNVKMTGYYTPVIKVRKTASRSYPHPIYKRPRSWEGPMPTRRGIEGEHALEGKGLELAYAHNRIDIYSMQLQGSGFVEFPDGTMEYFAYNGSNRHPYRSIEQFMLDNDAFTPKSLSTNGIKQFVKQQPELLDTILFHDPSYVFFKPKKSKPKGAGGVELIPMHSIAVDSRYIPLGSVLLAAVPILDEHYKVVDQQYTLLFAQDTGGAIKGSGHIDIYCGVGEKGERVARSISHYGQLWLLLPKNSTVGQS